MPPSPSTDSIRYTETRVPRPSRMGGSPLRVEVASRSGSRPPESEPALEPGSLLGGTEPPPTGWRRQLGQLARPAGTEPVHVGQCCQVSRSLAMGLPENSLNPGRRANRRQNGRLGRAESART